MALYNLKNQFWVGNYAEAVSEAAGAAAPSDSVRIERDFYRMRAEVEMGVEAAAVDRSLPSALQAVQLMAAFRAGKVARDAVSQTLEEWMGDENTADNPLLQIAVATIYNRMGDWNKALVCLKSEATLEHLALRAQIFVQMHRVDKAEADLKKMQQLDDDSTLTELTKGWVYCGMGKGMQEQGLYAFQELGAKFGRTLLVLNNVAACHIVLGNYSEADRCIDEALESGQIGAETFINAIVSAQLQGKGTELINDLVTKLEAVDARHPWLAARAENEKSFDAVASSFA